MANYVACTILVRQYLNAKRSERRSILCRSCSTTTKFIHTFVNSSLNVATIRPLCFHTVLARSRT